MAGYCMDLGASIIKVREMMWQEGRNYVFQGTPIPNIIIFEAQMSCLTPNDSSCDIKYGLRCNYMVYGIVQSVYAVHSAVLLHIL